MNRRNGDRISGQFNETIGGGTSWADPAPAKYTPIPAPEPEPETEHATVTGKFHGAVARANAERARVTPKVTMPKGYVAAHIARINSQEDR